MSTVTSVKAGSPNLMKKLDLLRIGNELGIRSIVTGRRADGPVIAGKMLIARP